MRKQWGVYEDGVLQSGLYFDKCDAEAVMSALYREEPLVKHEYYIDYCRVDV